MKNKKHDKILKNYSKYKDNEIKKNHAKILDTQEKFRIFKNIEIKKFKKWLKQI